MPQKIRANGIDRDEKFGVFRKRLETPNLPSFETPTRCLKNIRDIPQDFKINEIIKRITPEIVESIYSGQYQSPETIRKQHLPNKLNLTIFHLMYERVPEKVKLRTLTNYLYASSQSTLFLPTVKIALLKEETKISERKFEEYVEMMRYMIETTENTGNRLAFIGTVPLIAPKFTRTLVNLYLDKGITAFAIDGGTKDFLNHVAEFRDILSEISERLPLEKAFIYACNLGIPRYEANVARADDFLSILAYIDAFGTNFKTRGSSRMAGERRAKQFVKEQLFYKVSSYPAFCRERRMTLYEAMKFLPKFNLVEQLEEVSKVRNLVGKEKIENYLGKKGGVDEKAKERLGSIAETIKIT